MLNQVRDIMPSDHEFGEFQAPNAIFTCDDYLLDFESGESITKLDNHLGKGSENLVLESRREANKADYNGTPQEPELSGATNWMHDFPGDLHMNDYRSSGTFSCSADKEIAIEDRWFKYPASFPIESIEQLGDVSSMFSENEKSIILSPGLTSSEEMFHPLIADQQNEYGSVAQSTEGGSNPEEDVSRSPNQGVSDCAPAGKRLRKPPHRFIDELPEPSSKHVKKKISTPSSKGKFSKVKHHKHDYVKSTTEISLSEEPAAIAIQVPFGPLVCEESDEKQVPVAPKVLRSKPISSVAISEEDCVSGQKKQMPVAPKVSRSKPIASLAILEEEDFVSSRKKRMPVTPKAIDSKPVASVTTSEEDCVSIVKHGEDGRRKHHILWTVSEVKKLIDGVSQHGVGKWSHIKKDLFSSSAHRTAVDLKDKWRNLLKASCLPNEGKKGDDKKRNLAWRPLPKSIVHRVRELAIMYPYPRDLQTKH